MYLIRLLNRVLWFGAQSPRWAGGLASGDTVGVKIRALTNSSGKFEINTVNYPNGVYLATVDNDGHALLKSKFIILK